MKYVWQCTYIIDLSSNAYYVCGNPGIGSSTHPNWISSEKDEKQQIPHNSNCS